MNYCTMQFIFAICDKNKPQLRTPHYRMDKIVGPNKCIKVTVTYKW